MSGSEMTQQKLGLGWLHQQAILRFDRKGKSSKLASVCTLALLAV